MRDCSNRSFFCNEFLQGRELSFFNILSDNMISHALTAVGVFWMDRVYSPPVTPTVFLVKS